MSAQNSISIEEIIQLIEAYRQEIQDLQRQHNIIDDKITDLIIIHRQMKHSIESYPVPYLED